MAIDLLLDQLTYDLKIGKQDLSLATESDELAQHLGIRLRFIQGEWFLDTTTGIPFFESIWIKNPDINFVDDVLKSAILETDGVTELIEFESTFDNLQRTYTVTFKANTIYGEVTQTLEL